MKILSLVAILLFSVQAFADSNCKIGIDTDSLNDAQTAVVQNMVKQLQALGCTVGAPEYHTTPAHSVSTDESCAAGQTLTTQYGCVTPSGVCTIPGTNAQGVIYNNKCTQAIGSSSNYNNGYTYFNGGYYTSSPTNSCAAGAYATQFGCLSQGSCPSGMVSYNAQCYQLVPTTGSHTNGFYHFSL